MTQPAKRIPVPVSLRLLDNHLSQFNPLRGLDPRRVVDFLEDGERGAYAYLQWLYRFVEKRDATLRGCVRRLKSSLLKLDWDIKVQDDIPAGQKALADKQQAALRAAYERIENLRDALGHLSLAEFRGFAHLEKVFERDEAGRLVVTRLDPIPQWHWVREGIYGGWEINHDARSGAVRGEPVNPAQFVIRDVEDPIDEIAVIAFVRKNLSQKDWDGFVERYGLPYLFVEMPEGANSEDRRAYQEVADAILGGTTGAFPHGTTIHTADASNRGVNPFTGHIQYQDEQIVLAATSGLLTMLSKPQGIGGGASEEHGDTFADIALAQAQEISEVLQAQFDGAILDELFPGQPHLAYFEMAAKDEQDVGAVLDHAVKASQAGYRIAAAELSEKTGYSLTDAPPVSQPGPGGLFNRLFRRKGRIAANREPAEVPEEFEQASLGQMLTAGAAELEPLHELVAEHLDREDFNPVDLLADIEEQLPDIYRAMRALGHTDQALLDTLGTAAVAGLEAAAKARPAAKTKNRKNGLLRGVFKKWLR